MVTTHVLEGDFSVQVGPESKSVQAYLRTNLAPGMTLVNTDTGEVLLGGPQRIPLDGTSAFSLTLIATNSTGINVLDGTLRYYVDWTWKDGRGNKGSDSIGPFELTANTDLANAAVTATLDPTLASQALDEMQGMLDQVEEISGLTGEDEAVALLIDTPSSETATALSAAYARVVTPEAFGAIGDGIADDSAALTAMFAALGDGDLVQPRLGATYRYATALTATGIDDLHWNAGGRFVFAGTTASTSGTVAAMKFDGCNRLSGQIDIEVETQDREYTGLSFTGSIGVRLANARVFGARWVGISFDSACVDYSVDDCTSLQCRFGAYFSGSGWRVNGGRYSSEWSRTQEYVDKDGVWDSSSLYYDGIIVSGSTDWSVIGATLDDCGQSGIYGGGGNRRGSISGCLVFDNFNKGVDLGATGSKTTENSLSHIAVTGNVLRDNATGDIHFRHVDQSTITGNVVVRTDAADATPSIILNGASLGNAIVANAGSIASPTAAAVFVNHPDGAVGNMLWNQINATVAYSVTASANAVLDSSAGLRLTGQTLRGAKVTSDGDFTVGSGIAFLSDAAFLRLPRTASTNSGYLWYNATTGRLGYRDGVAALSKDVATVNSATTTQLDSVSDGINAFGKFAGKQAWNTSTGRPVWASGSTAAATWVYADGTTAHTPV